MRPSLPCQLRIRTTPARIPARARDVAAPAQKPLWAAYYRGGTSRAIILQPQELPSNRAKWPGIFRQLMGVTGARDGRGGQLSAMGTGGSSLSEICLVEPYHKSAGEEPVRQESTGGDTEAHAYPASGERALMGDVEGAHVDYTFVRFDQDKDEVDVSGISGNMSSAIGPYAYNARLLPREMYAVKDGRITIRIRNTNTRKFIDSTFSVSGGQAAVTGDYAMDGVAGKGSRIRLDFRSPYGSKTGKVLPTGRRIDVINGYRVTCIDGANPAVFVRADDIGVAGTILPDDFSKMKGKLLLLESIRAAAGVAMGLARTEKTVPRTMPTIAIVSQSSSHYVLSGEALKAFQMDLLVRFVSNAQPHRSMPLSAALTTAVAARIPGTIVEQLVAPELVVDDAITIGHASGRIQVKVMTDRRQRLVPQSATVYRTAQRLFEGKVFWSDTSNEPDEALGVTDWRWKLRAFGRQSLGMAFVTETRAREASRPPKEELLLEDKTDAREENVTPSKEDTNADAVSKSKVEDEASTPSLPEDPAHLLSSLSTLQTSLTHFTSLYPSTLPPPSPTFRPPVKTPIPTPTHISHHLTALNHHIDILTASLSALPAKPVPGSEAPTKEVAMAWHKWARTFRNIGSVRANRRKVERAEEREKREARKSTEERVRDRKLNSINAAGELVRVGKGRRNLLGGDGE